VREATITATAELVAEHGLTAVTMTGIAEKTGIGRATLYKYFPDVESILLAWHERQISDHLTHLAEICDQATPPKKLPAVLEAYAQLTRHSHDTALAAQLHRGQHVHHAQRHLHHFVRDLITEAAKAGRIRSDINADELTHYCLHALGAATDLRSRTAVHRLVTVTLNGLSVPTSTSATHVLTQPAPLEDTNR
jgi:AcrR family transcriptional regulator